MRGGLLRQQETFVHVLEELQLSTIIWDIRVARWKAPLDLVTQIDAAAWHAFVPSMLLQRW